MCIFFWVLFYFIRLKFYWKFQVLMALHWFLQFPGPDHLDTGYDILTVAYVSTVSSVLGIISDATEDYLTQMVRKTEYMTIYFFIRIKRDFSQNKVQNFKDSLNNLRWQNVLDSKDVNESFSLFWDEFYTLFELHFPIKKMKFNKNVHKFTIIWQEVF